MRATSPIPFLAMALTACLYLAVYPGFSGAQAQNPPAAPALAGEPKSLSYADLADLSIASPVVARVTVTDVIPLPAAQSAGVPQGYRRVYMEGRVSGLIRGDGGLAPAVSWLYDVPLDARGKLPKFRKRTLLLFARAGARPGQLQLVARDSQQDWTPDLESRTKAILSELLGARQTPVILGVGDAFHVAGTVAGEGETQIFLRTDSGQTGGGQTDAQAGGGQPVSLSIVRRPGESPTWAVALGEIVDEAAAMPRRDSLLWYRLACALPAELPDHAVRTLAVQDAEAARADYAVVLAGLGPCGRTRKFG